MKAKHFRKMVRETDLNKILYDYMFNELFLTNRQLDIVLNKRGAKKYPHYELIGKRKVIICD